MALKWNVSDEENEAVFLSTMDLHTFHLYQDIVVTKKYWHVVLFSSKEFIFFSLGSTFCC